ncbi:AAA family ATPase [Gordonia sp. TBRC 11910]|uniref:AAA family ATPase n=1 Tax=Gordonia asplenii TaxID=2725283 RepID=A0A848KZL4_9ACTN|nr:AAA family ATPase [Gordonia asplenii]NMO03849.1 AAA family ATPase [Gordonia asplenii]
MSDNRFDAVLRAPAEQRFAAELAALAARDHGPVPAGWRLSPRAVRTFILGDPAAGITRKFYGDDRLVERCIVTLMSDRGLLLVGEPGTAKSFLSELFSAAISGTSQQVVQGGVGTTEDKIAYTWNYALLIAEGPSERALVRAPLFQAMESGTLCRIEEITRMQPEISDTLIGVLSDKVLHIPELSESQTAATGLAARPGFNVIATANLRDRGVHDLSSALKRRFNFETVAPITDRRQQADLITAQTAALLRTAGVATALPPATVELLVDVFADLRSGSTADGVTVSSPAAVLSAAEAVAVGYAAALDAHYFDDAPADGGHIARQLIGTVLKDNADDGPKLDHYFDIVVRRRAATEKTWAAALSAHRESRR